MRGAGQERSRQLKWKGDWGEEGLGLGGYMESKER